MKREKMDGVIDTLRKGDIIIADYQKKTLKGRERTMLFDYRGRFIKYLTREVKLLILGKRTNRLASSVNRRWLHVEVVGKKLRGLINPIGIISDFKFVKEDK